MSDVSVRVYLPSLLEQAAGGVREVQVQARTLQGALDALLEQKPALAVHLFDESRALREHVNLFWNDQNLRWIDDWETALKEGDTLTVLQAVSGG